MKSFLQNLPRLLAALVLLGFVLFCIFGVFASGEAAPEDRLQWRIGYALAGLISLAGMIKLAKSNPDR